MYRPTRLLLGLVAALPCLAAAPPAAPLVSGRPLAAWLADLDDAEPLIREEAALVLGHAGSLARVAIPKLQKLLDHPVRPLRGRAAMALWRLTGDARPAVRVLTANLNDAGGSSVRQILADLAELGSDAAPTVEAIVPLLDDHSARVRHQAAQAISRIGRPGVPALMRALGHGDPRRRRNAVGVLNSYLSYLLTKAELPALRARLSDDDPHVRVDAARLAWALGQTDEAVLAALHEGIRSANQAIVANVLVTLNGPERPKSLVPLLEAALTAEAKTNRVLAARLLFEIEKNPRRVLPIYLAALASTNPEEWGEAVQALGELGEEARPALPRLLQILKQRDFHQHPEMQSALPRIGPACVPELVMLLDARRDDPELQQAQETAVVVLGALAHPAAVAVAPLVSSKSRVVSDRAVRVLQRIGPEAKAAVPHLVPLLDDPSAAVRENAVHALQGIGPGAKAAVPKLVKLAEGEEPVLRIGSLKALAQVGVDGAVAVPLATAALKDANERVQAAGVELLAAVQPDHDALVPAVVKLLESRSVRGAALRVVARLGHHAAKCVPAIVALLKSGDRDVWSPALEALAAIGPAAKDATPALLHLLLNGGDAVEQVLVSALRVVEADPKATVPALVKYLRGSERYGCFHVLALVGEYGPTAAEAFPVLAAIVRGPRRDTAIQPHAALALARVDPARARKECLPDLRRILHASPHDYRTARALLLLDPEDAEAVTAVEAGLTVAVGTYTRGSVCQQLAHLGPKAKRFLPNLRPLVKDRQGYARVCAALAIWRITGEEKEARAAVREVMAGTGRSYERLTVVQLLGELGADAKVFLPDLKAATDRDPELRRQVEQAIRTIERAVARKAGKAK